MNSHREESLKPRTDRLAHITPDATIALLEIGRAVEPLFSADEPIIARDSRSLYRRLVPDVTQNPQLRSAVPGLVESLLDALRRFGPKYERQLRAIEAAWERVVGIEAASVR